MKHLIIYHANCNDGFGAAWAAWKALKETGLVELHAASYGKEPPYELINAGINVHIVDFSYPPDKLITMCSMAKHVTMLDHHKTAIDSYAEYQSEPAENSTIIFDDSRSGAMLAWNYYHPSKQPPRIIEHIQDRDLWKFAINHTREVHLNLNTLPKELPVWDALITSTDASGFEFKAFVEGGKAIKRYYDNLIQNILATNKREVWIDGVKGLSCNCPGALASDLGHELANESGTFGLTWESLKDGNAKCSLRSNDDYDVSAIAKSFGGGGHKNAAGFVFTNSLEESARLKWGEK
jgi:oligoribonuclease NrnB/cAMP/cGMP phosphodiesterase (DHH superfamily)